MANTKKINDSTLVERSDSIIIVDEKTIRDKIYTIRGVKVMLDFELAEIYGYETKNFNRQVKNNAERFEGEDFMFQLTKSEVEELSRCKNFTSIQTKGVKGGRSNMPYAFTEQGVYLLMTVLRGELAIRQSRSLVKAFKAMKDYIVDNRALLSQYDYLHLSMQISDTRQTVQNIQNQLLDHGEKLNELFAQMQNTVKNSEISPFLLDFNKEKDRKEYLILNGEPAKADETYMDIYSKANKTLFIVDNYIDLKTLRLLRSVKQGVAVTIFSDNLAGLHLSDYNDFHTEFPNITLDFNMTGRTTHDRFIVLDFGTKDERIYHCGASSKDAGNKLMTAIAEMTDEDFMKSYHQVIQKYLSNPALVLR